MMVSNGRGLIVNVSPHKQMTRALNNISYQIERCGYEELTSSYAHELRKHNVSVLSLWVCPTKEQPVHGNDTGN